MPAEYRHAFTFRTRSSGDVKHFQQIMVASSDALRGIDANGKSLSVPAGSALLSSVLEYNQEFGITRDVDNWESLHYFETGQGCAGMNPAVWTLFGALRPLAARTLQTTQKSAMAASQRRDVCRGVCAPSDSGISTPYSCLFSSIRGFLLDILQTPGMGAISESQHPTTPPLPRKPRTKN